MLSISICAAASRSTCVNGAPLHIRRVFWLWSLCVCLYKVMVPGHSASYSIRGRLTSSGSSLLTMLRIVSPLCSSAHRIITPPFFRHDTSDPPAFYLATPLSAPPLPPPHAAVTRATRPAPCAALTSPPTATCARHGRTRRPFDDSTGAVFSLKPLGRQLPATHFQWFHEQHGSIYPPQRNLSKFEV